MCAQRYRKFYRDSRIEWVGIASVKNIIRGYNRFSFNTNDIVSFSKVQLNLKVGIQFFPSHAKCYQDIAVEKGTGLMFAFF